MPLSKVTYSTLKGTAPLEQPQISFQKATIECFLVTFGLATFGLPTFGLPAQIYNDYTAQLPQGLQMHFV